MAVMEFSMKFYCVSYLQLVSRGAVKIESLKTGGFLSLLKCSPICLTNPIGALLWGAKRDIALW